MSIKEVPRNSQSHHSCVLRIMRSKEIHIGSVSGVYVAEHEEEACVLEVHVGIYIYKGIAAEFHLACTVLLNGEPVELRTESGA